jgi:uncharacterized protein (TIGR01777 family)
MATILITGGTGLIGTALTPMLLSKGYEVIILTRQPDQENTGAVKYANWNVESGTIDKDAIARADYLIHLAGTNVGEKRWTKKRKKEILDSRKKSGEVIVKVLKEIPNKIQTVLSASGIGWYGPDTKISKQKGFNENDPHSNDFLGEVCEQWEESLKPVVALDKRLIIFRQGIVLSKEGGAFTEFKKPLKFGIAAILGSGKQVLSWIHIEDLCRMYVYALEKKFSGVFNAVAPQVISNKNFTLQLAKKVRGKFFIPIYVPSFGLKIVLGEMSIEVLKSATVNSEKIKSTGFQFLYPSIEAAFNNLMTNAK